MTLKRRLVDEPGPRRSPEFYDQTTEDVVLAAGDRMLLGCEGGPSSGRVELFPPRLELPDHGGVYVLDDIGPRAGWKYVFVANDGG